jgi:hypothetical protein
VSQHMRTHVLGQPRAIGHRLDNVLGTPRLDRERSVPRFRNLAEGGSEAPSCDDLSRLWGRRPELS